MTDTIYYKEQYVSGTPYYHGELTGAPVGESGTPIAFSIAGDGYISIALCLCMLLSILVASHSWRFTSFQFRNLFRTPRVNSVHLRETAKEMQYQVYFILQSVLLLGVLSFSVVNTHLEGDLPCSPYIFLGCTTTLFAVFFFVRDMMQRMVNLVYFDKFQRQMYGVARLFIMAVYGALLLPVTLLHVYLQIDSHNTLISVFLVLFACLLLRFYKTWSIFFRKNGNLFGYFLYLCTLEIVPLALLMGILLFTAHYLKINI